MSSFRHLILHNLDTLIHALGNHFTLHVQDGWNCSLDIFWWKTFSKYHYWCATWYKFHVATHFIMKESVFSCNRGQFTWLLGSCLVFFGRFFNTKVNLEEKIHLNAYFAVDYSHPNRLNAKESCNGVLSFRTANQLSYTRR